MKEYFDLQWKMISRKLKDAGFKPLIAYIILIIGFLGFSIYLFHKTEYAEYIYAFLGLSFVSKLSETKRVEFLNICFGDTKMKKIRITENLICTVPFLIFLIYKQHFLFALILPVLAILLALAGFRTAFNFTLWTPFSKKPFEFSIGFRNTFYLFIVAYALTIIAISVNNFNLGAFALMLVFATTLSYYTKPENEYYVWTYNVNAKVFLFRKIKTAILYSGLLALPIALVLAIFYHQNIPILGILFLIGWAILLSMIVGKYAAYPAEINITQSIFLAMSIWFLPMLIVIIPYLFKKSKDRLSSLLQ